MDTLSEDSTRNAIITSFREMLLSDNEHKTNLEGLVLIMCSEEGLKNAYLSGGQRR